MIKPDDKHPTNFLSVWKKYRDAVGGQRLIKKGAALYLKPLAGQIIDKDTAAYEAYLDRASYFNAAGRTLNA
jgi:hypothetical protein